MRRSTFVVTILVSTATLAAVWITGLDVAGQSADCGSKVAGLLLDRQFDQAAEYFQTPEGPLGAAAKAGTRWNLQQVLERSGARGTNRHAANRPSGNSRKVSVGHHPKAGENLLFIKTSFDVESSQVPGLILSLNLVPGKVCAVYAIELESYDSIGMQRLQALQPSPATASEPSG